MTNVNPYAQALLADENNPDFGNQLAYYLGGEAAPGIGQGGETEAEQLAQAVTAPAGLAVTNANLAVGEGQQLASDYLNYQGIGLQQQGLASQIGTAAEQQQVEQKQYGLSQKQIGLQEQGTALSEANLAYQTPIQYQKQGSAAAQAGATNSQGNKQATGGIQEQAAYQGSQLGLQAQGEFLQSQMAKLGQQGEQIGYAGQQSQYSNQYQQLQLAAQQADIPVQQLASMLAYQSQQNGIAADPTSAIGKASQSQSQQAQILQALGAQYGATNGIGPQAGANLYASNPEVQAAEERMH